MKLIVADSNNMPNQTKLTEKYNIWCLFISYAAIDNYMIDIQAS